MANLWLDLRELRKRAGLSQIQTAVAMGVTAGTIGRWEVNQSIPSRSQCQGLAELLGLLPEEMELAFGYLPQSLQSHKTVMELILRLSVLPSADYWAVRGALRDCVTMLPKPPMAPNLTPWRPLGLNTEPISNPTNGGAGEPKPSSEPEPNANSVPKPNG